MDTRELAPRYFQIARQFGAAGQGERVVFGEQRIDADIDADLDGGAEFDTLRAHLLDAAVDDGAFDRLDRHRVVVDVQRTAGLARRRTDAAGEFRKIVGRVQRYQSLTPLVAIDEVIPVRDQIVDRAALVAERDAAIHAARGLGAQGRLRKGFDELLPALFARRRLVIAAIGALDLEKPGRLAHAVPERPGPGPVNNTDL